MEEARNWIGFIIQIIITLVSIVWFFAKLDKRISLISQEMNIKFKIVNKGIDEIKNNHLAHLSTDIKEISDKFTKHLINHK